MLSTMKATLVIFFLLGIALAHSAATNQSYGVISADDVNYYFYSRKHPEGVHITHSTVGNLKSAGFSASKETIFLLHGYWSYYSSKPFPQVTTTQLLAVNDWNVFCIDWSPIWKNNQQGVVLTSLGKVGSFIGSVVNDMQKQLGLKLGNLRIVGHSVGAHIAGTTGLALKGEPELVVGLDPAHTEAESDHVNRIWSGSGKRVEIIHSGAGAVGIPFVCGHVDYWPNGGNNQPGCNGNAGCDHGRAIDYWAESITSNKFIAHKCDSWASFQAGKCKSNPTAVMGTLKINTQPTGNYYLATNDHAPFAKG